MVPPSPWSAIIVFEQYWAPSWLSYGIPLRLLSQRRGDQGTRIWNRSSVEESAVPAKGPGKTIEKGKRYVMIKLIYVRSKVQLLYGFVLSSVLMLHIWQLHNQAILCTESKNVLFIPKVTRRLQSRLNIIWWIWIWLEKSQKFRINSTKSLI